MTATNRWLVDTGAGTLSGGTGPSGGQQDSTIPGDNYAYIEASTSSRYTSLPSNLTTPPVTINAAGGYVRFYYHMYGADTGSLTVLSCPASGSCTPLLVLNGQQQSSSASAWRAASASLPASTNTVMWTATRPGSFRGDISIDTITIGQGTAPPTVPPTPGPPCLAQGTNDFFRVSFSSPQRSCKGVSGSCYVTSSGQCFTDGDGNYANSERCTIQVLRTGNLFTQSFSLASSADYFRISGSFTRRYQASQINGQRVNAGQSLTWYSSSSNVASGFVICATPLPPCGPISRNTTFIVTAARPRFVSGTCAGGLGPTTSASTCYTTTSGSCFTDGPGNHGNNERCTISVLRPIRLSTSGTFSLGSGDYFTVTGSSTRYTTSATLSTVVLSAGDTINWYSNFFRTGTGFTVCAAPAPPPPAPVTSFSCDFNTPTASGPGQYKCGMAFTGQFRVNTRGGSTPSFNTGPGMGQLGSRTDRYAFIETSGGRVGTASTLQTPPLSVTGTGYIQFSYSMYGATIGSLVVSSCVGNVCSPRMTKIGNQHTATVFWTQVTLLLPKGTTSVLFNATRGTSFTGDIAIDTIRFGQGTPPATPAPTMPPQCSATSAGAFFAVRSSNPVQTCFGGGGPTSATQGSCFTTSSGSCFTDGPGDYANNERCTISVLRNSFLFVQGTVDISSGDYFLVSGSFTRRRTFASLDGMVLAAGQNITWFSGTLGTGAGYTLCASATSRAPVVPPSVAPTSRAPSTPAPTTTPVTSFSCNFPTRTNWCGMRHTGQWRLDNLNTGSIGTGPAAGQGGASDHYAYTETSGGSVGTTSILETPTLTFGPNGGYVTFYYHMFGATIGTLRLQSCTTFAALTCNTLWTRTGQQHSSLSDPWSIAAVVLPQNTVSVRWVGIRGTSFTGDIAVDTITIGQGSVPVTAAPTNPPACTALASTAVFSVAQSSPLQTCGGGSGPTSATQGTCYTTNSGTCFTDGPGNHGNNEACTFVVHRPTRLSVTSLSLQTNADYFTVGFRTTRLDTTRELNNFPVAPGTPIVWRSSSTTTRPGYTICAGTPPPAVSSFTCDFNSPTSGTGGPNSQFWCGMIPSNQWTIDVSGQTSSSNTGPNAGQAGGADNYAYLETSGGVTGLQSVLATPPLTIGSNGGYLTFYYHMYGATIGNISVQTCVGQTCTSQWSQSGQQHTSHTDAWSYAAIPIPAQTEWVQWVAHRGRSFTGDISIDTINIGNGAVPATAAPTTPPSCGTLSSNAMFMVTASAPINTCAGGSGPTSISQGSCYTTTSGICISNDNGQGYHANNERCTISVLSSGTLFVHGPIGLQINQDYFLLSGSGQRLDTANEINNRSVQAGQTLSWRSSATTTGRAFTVCGTALPACSTSRAAGAYFVVTGTAPVSTCNTGSTAGPTSANEGTVYTTSSGTCINRMAGPLGTFERATISVLRSGFLNVVSLNARPNIDYFTITGSTQRLDTPQELNGRAVTIGQTINWFSNFPVATTSFSICAVTSTPPPTAPTLPPVVAVPPVSTFSCDFMSPTTGDLATRVPTATGSRFFCGMQHTGLWLIDVSGSTSSANTGPPFGQGGWFDNYAHIETSSANAASTLTTPPLALPHGGTLSFYYFMYGATIGTLQVKACSGGMATMSCNTVWSRTGQQQTSTYFSSWLQASSVNLPAGTTYVQFDANRTTSFTGDISIDTIRITAGTPSPTMSPTMSPSMSPTMSPTMSPSMSPTMSPTMSPAAPTPAASASSGSNSSSSDGFLIYFIIAVVVIIVLLAVVLVLAKKKSGGGDGIDVKGTRTFDNPLYADQTDATAAHQDTSDSTGGNDDGGYMDTSPADDSAGYMDLPVAQDYEGEGDDDQDDF